MDTHCVWDACMPSLGICFYPMPGPVYLPQGKSFCVLGEAAIRQPPPLTALPPAPGFNLSRYGSRKRGLAECFLQLDNYISVTH